MIISLPTSSWFYRLVHVILIALIAWFGAGLVWLILAPRATPPVAAPARVKTSAAVLDMTPLVTLFGGRQAEGEASASSLSVKLRGVIAARDDQPAVAIFERNGAPALALRTGEELEPGVRLIEVAADHAVVDNHGRHERIELDATAAAQGIVAANGAPPPQPPTDLIKPAQGENHPPPSPRGASKIEQRAISRETLAAGMQHLNVNEWSRGINDSPDQQGVVIADASAQPLAGSLGLQNGDVLRSVNGVAMTHKSDISNLYGAFSRAPYVNVEVVRNGTPMTLHYRIENQPTP